MAIWHLLLYLSHARVSTRRKFKHKPWTWICWKTTYLLGGLVTLQGLWLLNFGCVGPLDTCYVWLNLEGHPICLVWVPRCHICMKSKSNLAVEPTPWKKYWSTWESSPNSSENNKYLKPPSSSCINPTIGAGILSNSSISPIGLSCALMVFQLALQFKQSIFNCAKSFLGAKCSRVSCQYIASHHGLMACPQAQLLSWRFVFRGK